MFGCLIFFLELFISNVISKKCIGENLIILGHEVEVVTSRYSRMPETENLNGIKIKLEDGTAANTFIMQRDN